MTEELWIALGAAGLAVMVVGWLMSRGDPCVQAQGTWESAQERLDVARKAWEEADRRAVEAENVARRLQSILRPPPLFSSSEPSAEDQRHEKASQDVRETRAASHAAKSLVDAAEGAEQIARSELIACRRDWRITA